MEIVPSLLRSCNIKLRKFLEKSDKDRKQEENDKKSWV